MFDKHLRSEVERVTVPIGSAVGRSGITPDHLTATGLVFAAAATVAIGTGRLGLGLGLYIAAALPDMFDGAVAKATGTSSARGAFFDSVADRVTDMAILGGIAYYLAGEDGGRAAMLPMAAMALGVLISYERARAESLGYNAKGGLMERAERTIALMIGLAFSAVLVPVLWIMVALTAITAVHRFVMVWKQADKPVRKRRVTRERSQRDRVTWSARADRFRAWREQMAAEGRLGVGTARRERTSRRSRTRRP